MIYFKKTENRHKDFQQLKKKFFLPFTALSKNTFFQQNNNIFGWSSVHLTISNGTLSIVNSLVFKKGWKKEFNFDAGSSLFFHFVSMFTLRNWKTIIF